MKGWILPVVAALAGPASGAVVDSGASGFTVSVERRLGPDSPEARQAVWSILIAPDRWWSSAHSWSGDASNMTLDPKVGGCWCERLKDGGMVEHARVLAVEPQKRLLLRGELGPMQTLAAVGKLELSVGTADGQTVVTLRYAIAGYGFGDTVTFANAVDGVISEQADRLAAVAKRGS